MSDARRIEEHVRDAQLRAPTYVAPRVATIRAALVGFESLDLRLVTCAVAVRDALERSGSQVPRTIDDEMVDERLWQLHAMDEWRSDFGGSAAPLRRVVMRDIS